MADLTGERLGPFEIQSLIGVGGFASVYLANDPRLDADVAIKILAENHSLNPDVRGRFLSEATALRRVDSPSVIQLHDIREAPDGRPYLVMALADRGDLATRRSDRERDGWDPTPGDARALVGALSDALDAIHSERLVHRDVTPSNLLIRSGRRTTFELGVAILDVDERFVLSDLGLAKDLSEGTGLTRGGGTAGFSAPEQQQPLAKIDSRTDIYSASALIVWLLTDKAPSAQADWIQSLRSNGWSGRLVGALEKGLAADPEDRYQSILDWQRSLENALAFSEDRSRKVVDRQPIAPRQRAVRGRRNTLGALALGLAMLAGLTTFAATQVGDGVPDSPETGIGPSSGDSVQVTVETTTEVTEPEESVPTAELNTTPTPAQGLVFGYDESRSSENWERPEFFESILDPAYGTLTTRTSSADSDERHLDVYSKRNPENADGTFILMGDGPRRFAVKDAIDGSLVKVLRISPDEWPNWHPTDPGLIRHISEANGDLKFYETDATTGERTEIADLTDRIEALYPTATQIFGRRGGAPSMDGSRYVWYLRSETEELVGAISYDVDADQILGTMAAADFPDAGQFDGLYMSPTGEYIVSIQWTGTYVYDADFTNERLIFPGFYDSGDVVLNDAGRDSFVYFDDGTPLDPGWLISADLTSLDRTRIFNLFDDAGTLIDISGGGFEKPGWVVASTYDCKLDFAWACDKVMAVELKPDGRVLNLAHTYHCGEESWYSTEAVVNRGFSRIYFNSDTGRCGEDAEALKIDVPAFE